MRATRKAGRGPTGTVRGIHDSSTIDRARSVSRPQSVELPERRSPSPPQTTCLVAQLTGRMCRSQPPAAGRRYAPDEPHFESSMATDRHGSNSSACAFNRANAV
jgi:hypothetical protein